MPYRRPWDEVGNLPSSPVMDEPRGPARNPAPPIAPQLQRSFADTRSQEQKRAYRKRVGAMQEKRNAALRGGKTPEEVMAEFGNPNLEKEKGGLPWYNFLMSTAKTFGPHSNPMVEYDILNGLARDKATGDPFGASQWRPIEELDPGFYQRYGEWQNFTAKNPAAAEDPSLWFGNEGFRQMRKYNHIEKTPDGRFLRTEGTDPANWYYVDKYNRKVAPYQGGPTGSGGGAGGPGGGTGGAGGIEGLIASELEKIIGGDTAFSPSVTSALEGRAFQASQGRAKARREALDESLVQSGLSRSGARIKGQQDIERQAGAEYTGAVRDIGITAATENFRNRLDALDRAQRMLDQKRAYELGKEGNDITRQTNLAQIQLGYARIEAEREALQSQLANSLQLANLQISGGLPDQIQLPDGTTIPSWLLRLTLGG